MLFTYSLGSRIGFFKFLILLATIVNSILIAVNFDNIAGAGGINFVQDVNLFCIIPVTFISIAIYAFRWNEWMWGLKALPWVKCEFWWSIIAAITTGVGFIIILASTLSHFNNTTVEEEGIASSLICLFVCLLYSSIAYTMNNNSRYKEAWEPKPSAGGQNSTNTPMTITLSAIGLNPVAQEALTSAISNAVNNISQKSKETKSTIHNYSEQTCQKVSAKTQESKVTLSAYAEKVRSTLGSYKQLAAEKMINAEPLETSKPARPPLPTLQ